MEPSWRHAHVFPSIARMIEQGHREHSPKELRQIQRLVIQHQEEFLEEWHGHLGAGG